MKNSKHLLNGRQQESLSPRPFCSFRNSGYVLVHRQLHVLYYILLCVLRMRAKDITLFNS